MAAVLPLATTLPRYSNRQHIGHQVAKSVVAQWPNLLGTPFLRNQCGQAAASFRDDVTNVVKTENDCRSRAIAQSLALQEPKYQETAAYCHFGRQPIWRPGCLRDILINASKQWTWRKKPSGQLPRRGIDSAVGHLSNPLRGAESGSDPQRSKEGSC